MNIIFALQKIIANNGLEILNNPRMIIALVADYVSGFEKEKKFLKIASVNGVFEIIYEMSRNSSSEEKNNLKVKALHKLEADALISKENAEMIIDLIMSGAGLIESPFDENCDLTDHWAQYAVGFAFEFGTTGEQNYKKAVEWYRKSAEQGNAWSQNRLGECYLNGNGTQKDLREAKKWFELASEQGDETAKQNFINLH